MADNIKYKRPKQVAPEHQEIISEIGKRLEGLRKKRGTSAAFLCRVSNISRNSYRQMEKGEIYFSFENFLKVLNFHKIPIHNFFDKNFEKLLSVNYFNIFLR